MPIAILSGILTRQPMHAARTRHQPDPRLGKSEARVVSRYNDVASQRDLETAAESESVSLRQ